MNQKNNYRLTNIFVIFYIPSSAPPFNIARVCPVQIFASGMIPFLVKPDLFLASFRPNTTIKAHRRLMCKISSHLPWGPYRHGCDPPSPDFLTWTFSLYWLISRLPIPLCSRLLLGKRIFPYIQISLNRSSISALTFLFLYRNLYVSGTNS